MLWNKGVSEITHRIIERIQEFTLLLSPTSSLCFFDAANRN
jgi:hypothetical protein